MADLWEYDCPQFLDFTESTTEDHVGDNSDSWFDMDHEAESSNVAFETPPGTGSKNASIIISDTTPVIVTKTMSVCPPKDPIIEDVNQEVSVQDSDGRSALTLNNRTNVLSKDEFYRNAKNRNLGKPPVRVHGKENAAKENAAKKGPSRVLRKPSALQKGTNERLAMPQKNTEGLGVSAQRPHRRSLSAGNLGLNEMNERPKFTLPKPNKKSSLQKFDSTAELNPGLNPRRSVSVEKLNHRRSVSVEKLNPRRSVSVEKLNPRRSVSVEKLIQRRSVSTENMISNKSRSNSVTSINSDKSDASGASTFTKPSGVPKIRAKLVPSAYRPAKSNNSKQLTSVDLEMLKIEKKRQEASVAKKLAAESLKKSLQSKSYVPIHSDLQVTAPKVFEFKSDKRPRTRSADFAKSPNNVFAQNLRKDNHQSNKPPKRTVVQPFNLTENKRITAPPMKFQTVAEQIRNFSKKTPERFRLLAKDNKSHKPRLTIPKTPTFTCQMRSRPVHILSTKEIEDKEIDEIQKYQFKAKEVDHKLFEGRTGVKEVVKKEATIPEPFDLPGSKVPSTRKEVEEKQPYEFHARPLPAGILEGVLGVKPAEPMALTVPASPAFALKLRMQRFAALEPKQETLIQKVKARPYVHSGIKFEPKLEHRTTVAEPFTFFAKIKESLIKKEQKRQQMIDEETKTSDFSAQPVPDFSLSGVPRKRAPSLTKPAPFNLHIEERVEKRMEEKQQQLEDENRLQQERMHFKAQSCEVVKRAPFVPHLEHKCTQEHSTFKLYTETRHAERAQFEEEKKAREADLMAMTLETARLREEEEEREVQKMRLAAVHKAQPIRSYKPLEIQHPSHLTVPVTPKLSTKNRVRNNESHDFE